MGGGGREGKDPFLPIFIVKRESGDDAEVRKICPLTSARGLRVFQGLCFPILNNDCFISWSLPTINIGKTPSRGEWYLILEIQLHLLF